MLLGLLLVRLILFTATSLITYAHSPSQGAFGLNSTFYFHLVQINLLMQYPPAGFSYKGNVESFLIAIKISMNK
jgi:hypothetical protein